MGKQIRDEKKDRILLMFIQYLRTYYRSKDQYNTQHLQECFFMYIQFLKKILGEHHELIQMTDRQKDAFKLALSKPESIWHRSRRSGKTLGVSHLLIFFALIEFGICHGKVIYRTPYVNQLKGIKQWLKQNPFFISVRKQEYEVDILGCKFPLDVACISDATSSGLECSVLIEDEYQDIDHDSELETWARDTRAFLLKGELFKKRHIHISTGRVNTMFEADYQALLEYDPDAIDIMPWWECDWITQDQIDKDKRANFDAVYWIEEQYECRWVNASGQFFHQDNLHIVQNNYFDELGLSATLGGLDWNGEETGHIMLIGCWDGYSDQLYLIDELRFDKVSEVDEYIRSHNINVEVEGKPKQMGYNAGFSDHLRDLHTQNVTYQNWGEEGVKDQRLSILQRCQVYVSQKCRWFIKNFREATFKKDDKDTLPKLKKLNNQHGLDACLHMLHTSNGFSTFIDQNYPSGNSLSEILERQELDNEYNTLFQ